MLKIRQHIRGTYDVKMSCTSRPTLPYHFSTLSLRSVTLLDILSHDAAFQNSLLWSLRLLFLPRRRRRFLSFDEIYDSKRNLYRIQSIVSYSTQKIVSLFHYITTFSLGRHNILRIQSYYLINANQTM